eukprot:3208353-Rhodomonas_salina.2
MLISEVGEYSNEGLSCRSTRQPSVEVVEAECGLHRRVELKAVPGHRNAVCQKVVDLLAVFSHLAI